jgi:hypothetical protein
VNDGRTPGGYIEGSTVLSVAACDAEIDASRVTKVVVLILMAMDTANTAWVL